MIFSLSIQNGIENRSQKEILNWINANDPTAQLLADTAIEVSDLKTIATNTTVGQDSFIEDTVFKITQTEFPIADLSTRYPQILLWD